MKKLSLLVALVLLVTVGGVYATWNYATLQMNEVEHTFKNLGITDVNTNTQTGKVAVTDTLILKIDDNDGSYTPAWDIDVTDAVAGKLLIAFTPNPGADNTTLKYTITIANNTYTPHTAPVAIFSVNGDKTAHTEAEEVLSGTFTYTAGNASATEEITFADITASLGVNGDFTLPTLDDYNNYKTALQNVKLILTITEVRN